MTVHRLAPPAATRMEAGQVFFRGEAPWLEELEHELLSFPNGRHDDQVDPFCPSSPWSLTSLVAVVGISRGHLIRIQNGTRAPSLIVAMRLVDALDLDPDTGLGADLIRHSVAGVGHDRW